MTFVVFAYFNEVSRTDTLTLTDNFCSFQFIWFDSDGWNDQFTVAPSPCIEQFETLITCIDMLLSVITLYTCPMFTSRYCNIFLYNLTQSIVQFFFFKLYILFLLVHIVSCVCVRASVNFSRNKPFTGAWNECDEKKRHGKTTVE